MKLVQKILARNRIRTARRKLAQEPSPTNYAILASEFARLGLTREVQRTCKEGLEVFPDSRELSRLHDRAVRLEREQRLLQLKRELEESPRSAVWKEFCDLLLESKRLDRAESAAQSWIEIHHEPEAYLVLARVHVARYLAGMGREEGRAALASLGQTDQMLPDDVRVLQLKRHLFHRMGAWQEAAACVEALLRHEPGRPELEAAYRTLTDRAEGPTDFERALLLIEQTGRFFGEDRPKAQAEGARGDVRPVLRKLASSTGIQAAVYVRGATALVHGMKGATAERTARTVGGVLASARASARKLGLGPVVQVQLEGDFGRFTIAPGEMDAGALWSRDELTPNQERALVLLAGMNADLENQAPEVDA